MNVPTPRCESHDRDAFGQRQQVRPDAATTGIVLVQILPGTSDGLLDDISGEVVADGPASYREHRDPTVRERFEERTFPHIGRSSCV